MSAPSTAELQTVDPVFVVYTTEDEVDHQVIGVYRTFSSARDHCVQLLKRTPITKPNEILECSHRPDIHVFGRAMPDTGRQLLCVIVEAVPLKKEPPIDQTHFRDLPTPPAHVIHVLHERENGIMTLVPQPTSQLRFVHGLQILGVFLSLGTGTERCEIERGKRPHSQIFLDTGSLEL